MRINHNMLAINTHRQLGGVALAQSKSMEKLSSGYRINRAGDDAAGLAISEKMRAQIRGLNTAAKNAQDGISLVQTAEGALQEVHGMLNRMVELATQSANGTFDDEVDRKNLESEIVALKGEIDRVAKSANFNGIKLLNGDLGNAVAAGKHREVTVNVAGAAAAVKEIDALAGVYGLEAQLTKMDANKTGKYVVKWNDEAGNEHRLDIDAVVGNAATNANVTITLDGEELLVEKDVDLNTADKIDVYVKDKLDTIAEFKEIFDTTLVDKKLVFTNVKKGDSQAKITEVMESVVDTTAISTLAPTSVQINVTASRNVSTEVDTAIMAALAAGDFNDKAKIDKATVVVDGEKFVAVQKDALNDEKLLKALKESGVDPANIIWDDDAASDADSVSRMAKRINEVFGKDTVRAAARKLIFETQGARKSTKGLILQVGESSESYQKLTVSVNEMSSKGLAITSVSVASQDVAAKSISKIREAINTVSAARGDLGALQNRLEHTISNLNTTAENITASESRIRDVDMAKEMVELTKVNILQQAAQAMLAQANQAPQGVLQLLR